MCQNEPGLKEYKIFMDKLDNVEVMKTVHELMDILANKNLTVKEIITILNVTKGNVQHYSILPQNIREVIQKAVLKAQDQNKDLI